MLRARWDGARHRKDPLHVFENRLICVPARTAQEPEKGGGARKKKHLMAHSWIIDADS